MYFTCIVLLPSTLYNDMKHEASNSWLAALLEMTRNCISVITISVLSVSAMYNKLTVTLYNKHHVITNAVSPGLTAYFSGIRS